MWLRLLAAGAADDELDELDEELDELLDEDTEELS